MKILKFIGLGLLGIIVLFFLAALFTSKEIKYSKSIVVNATPAEVWEHCGSLKAMDTWSPWNARDPHMEKTFSGTPGQVGEINTWTSDSSDVGTGSQEVTAIDAPNSIETDLKFMSPREDVAKAYVRLKAVDGGTEVTWGFESEAGVPFNLIMSMIGMESLIGADYQQGLDNLKALAEQ